MGSTLAARLSREGHAVVVVENDGEHLRSLNEHLDVQTVSGSGTTVGVLREAGIEECDVLFACTSSDEVNMIAALIGTSIFHVPKVVARLRELDHQAGFSAVEIHDKAVNGMLSPEFQALHLPVAQKLP